MLETTLSGRIRFQEADIQRGSNRRVASVLTAELG